MSEVIVNDAVWRKLRRKLKRMDGAHVRVGVLSNRGGNKVHAAAKRGAGGRFMKAEGITMVELAAIHEFGSPKRGIPRRSFIKAGVEYDRFALREQTRNLASAIVENKLTHKKALDLLGLWGAAQIKNYVQAGGHITPKLDERTEKRKGSKRPLIDTGRMVNSVQHEVKD